MKKGMALLLLFAITVSLCACGLGRSKAERYAKEGWERVGERDIELDDVYVMQYTSRRNLSDEVLDTDMYFEIPETGYAVLYHSYAIPAFSDSYACFFNERGDIVFTFDYEEYDELYEEYYADFSLYNTKAGEKALEYLMDCNYISHMINYANDSEEYSGNMEKNVWYTLDEKQIKYVGG